MFVDDGSNDETLAWLRTITEQNHNIHYISLSRNFGKEAALFAGLEKALILGAEYICVMDVDLQDPPQLLPQMLERLVETGADVCASYRASRSGEPPIRSFFAHTFYKLMQRFSGLDLKDGARDFRVMRRCVVETIVAMPERARFSKGLFSWVGYKTEWIGYDNVERVRGETHWNFIQLARYALDGIVDFSALPLEVISLAGLTVFVLSLIFLLFIVIRAALFGDPVAGWPSMVCLITLFSGLQLLCIGVLGLYLSKVFTEVKKRPIYVVREER